MIHLTLKHCKAIICLSALMLTSVCGSAQYYRHGRLVADPWAFNHSVMIMNDIAKQAMFEGIVLRDFTNEAICMHRDVLFHSADVARACAEEIALSATEPIIYDLLALSNINDRDLRNVGIGLACAHLALSASAIHNANMARKEAAEAQQASADSTLTDNKSEQRYENKAAKALTTLAIMEAAAITLDALFGNYPRAPRHRYHHHYHRHYYPYY